MLNTKVSVQMYPDDVWNVYISAKMKKGESISVFKLIDSLGAVTITDILPKLYNKVLEKHLSLKYRS